MNIHEKYHYWLNHAKYDLDSAEAMFKMGKWMYVVFMCQQAVEKLAKGIYGLYLDFDAIPRTHNIRRLVNDFADKLPQTVPEDVYSLFDVLTRYYINSRYPDYIDDMLQQVNENTAKHILAQTEEAFTWLQTLKP